MKRKIVSLFTPLILCLLIILSFAGCSASDKYNDIEEYAEYAVEDTVDVTNEENVVEDNRKIIENVDMSVQTKEFDKLIDNLNNQIKKLGGYIESSDVYGREYDSDDTRRAEFKIRIPSDKSSNFTDFVSTNSVVVNKSISTEDVTLKYVDMESRVNVLEAEKTALEKLLKNASSTSDIIQIREKLTEVISSIESYKSQLRTYDNLVSYTTVVINISEVERTVVVENQNTWQKIGTNLKNNFISVWNIIVGLFVFVISAIPYLIPFAIIGAVIIIVLKISAKKKK